MHFRTWPVFYYETKITLFTQPNTVNISKFHYLFTQVKSKRLNSKQESEYRLS